MGRSIIIASANIFELLKVEETNSAVNLLCSAISALIDNAITGGNIEQLKSIKIKLDEKKEIV
mgnify:CR=1 FL=1